MRNRAPFDFSMALTIDDVLRIAHLARIDIDAVAARDVEEGARAAQESAASTAARGPGTAGGPGPQGLFRALSLSRLRGERLG